MEIQNNRGGNAHSNAPQNAERKKSSLRKRIGGAIKNSASLYAGDVFTDADTGKKLGKTLADKLTCRDLIPEKNQNESKFTENMGKVGYHIGGIVSVYTSLAKLPLNVLKDKKDQPKQNISNKKIRKRDITGSHLGKYARSGLDVGQELGRRITGLKGDSIEGASRGTRYTIRGLQVAGFITGGAFAYSSAPLALPTMLILRPNQSFNDYVNPTDSEYKYTGMARRQEAYMQKNSSEEYLPSPPSYEQSQQDYGMPVSPPSPQNTTPAPQNFHRVPVPPAPPTIFNPPYVEVRGPDGSIYFEEIVK